MSELDFLFSNNERDFNVEPKKMNNFKIPFAVKAGWKLTTSLVIGAIVLSAAGFVSSAFLIPSDDFMTTDANEKILIDQMNRYCKPSLLQIIGNGFDSGTCKQKLRDMSSYIASKDRGEDPALNEDVLSQIDSNAAVFKERVKRNKPNTISYGMH